jgi:hypothetical protein
MAVMPFDRSSIVDMEAKPPNFCAVSISNPPKTAKVEDFQGMVLRLLLFTIVANKNMKVNNTIQEGKINQNQSTIT